MRYNLLPLYCLLFTYLLAGCAGDEEKNSGTDASDQRSKTERTQAEADRVHITFPKKGWYIYRIRPEKQLAPSEREIFNDITERMKVIHRLQLRKDQTFRLENPKLDDPDRVTRTNGTWRYLEDRRAIVLLKKDDEPLDTLELRYTSPDSLVVVGGHPVLREVRTYYPVR